MNERRISMSEYTLLMYMVCLHSNQNKEGKSRDIHDYTESLFALPLFQGTPYRKYRVVHICTIAARSHW